NWDTGFKFVFISGDSMGGVPLVLDKAVIPGAELELSISMTAPNKTGPLTGHWRMSTASGTLFGDDVFVAILLGNATSTPSSTAITAPTPTDTPTPTNTPGG
ncbi:MAG TPA: NBR1-Ig-like domain-containing protein, partial [Anaerolineales bacterium]